jgi:ArsR family transcriptional regulator
MNDKTNECCRPEVSRAAFALASPEADAELALIAKALAHPVRVRILRILLERHACLCGEIVAALPLSQATVSQHLKVLKQAGLVQGEIDGPRVCYCASPGRIADLAGLVDALAGIHVPSEREVVRS